MAILLISAFVMPPFMFLLAFSNLIPQDGMTLEEVEAEVLSQLVRHPLFWLWLIYAIIIVSFTMYAHS